MFLNIFPGKHAPDSPSGAPALHRRMFVTPIQGVVMGERGGSDAPVNTSEEEPRSTKCSLSQHQIYIVT